MCGGLEKKGKTLGEEDMGWSRFYEREIFLQEKGSRERQKNCKGKLCYEGPNLFYEA